MKGETLIVIAGLAGLGAYLFRTEIKQALQSFAPAAGGGSGGGSGDTSGYNEYPLGNQPMLPGGAYRYGFYDPGNLNNPALQTATADSPFRSSRTSGGLDILPARPGDATSSFQGSSTPIGDSSSSSGFGMGDLGQAAAWGAAATAGGLILEKALGGGSKIANMARGRVVPSQAAENLASRTAASDAARAAETKAAQKVETSVASKMLGTEARAAVGSAARVGGTILAYSTAATTAGDYLASAAVKATSSMPNLQNSITSAARRMESNPVGNAIMRAGSALSLRPVFNFISGKK